MERNIGKYDKIIRIGVGATLILMVLPFAHATIGSTMKIVLGILGAILLITGLINFCPIYKVCKISTHKVSDADMKDLMK